MSAKIQFKRGNEGTLPTLDAGEPGWTTDTSKLFIGTGSGNVEIAKASYLGDYIPLSQKGAANGVATLDSGGKIPFGQLPAIAITDVNVVADIAARDALTVQEGDVAIVNDDGSGSPNSYIYDGISWQELKKPAGVVSSVNGYTGAVVLTTDDISEGTTNLYYTDARVSANSDVAANTSHRSNTSNPHNVTAAQIGASNILTELKTVDGAGSGLDADLLDGKHASSFPEINGTPSTGDILKFNGSTWDPIEAKILSTKAITTGSVLFYDNNVTTGLQTILSVSGSGPYLLHRVYFQPDPDTARPLIYGTFTITVDGTQVYSKSINPYIVFASSPYIYEAQGYVSEDLPFMISAANSLLVQMNISSFADSRNCRVYTTYERLG